MNLRSIIELVLMNVRKYQKQECASTYVIPIVMTHF
jgi:hypothetical protein